jgi:hypothetical protein
MTPSGGKSSARGGQPSLPLRWAKRTFMKGKPSRRRNNTRENRRPQRACKTFPHGRTRSISRTYPPVNGSKYSACWSRITACGTAAWERWPPRPIESRSSPVPSPCTPSRRMAARAAGLDFVLSVFLLPPAPMCIFPGWNLGVLFLG